MVFTFWYIPLSVQFQLCNIFHTRPVLSTLSPSHHSYSHALYLYSHEMEEKYFSCLNILPELHNCEEGRWKIFCIFRPDMMTMTIQKPDSRYEYKVIMSSLLWVSICKHSEPFTFVSGCGDNDWRQCGIVSKNVKHLITGFLSGLGAGRRKTPNLSSNGEGKIFGFLDKMILEWLMLTAELKTEK